MNWGEIGIALFFATFIGPPIFIIVIKAFMLIRASINKDAP